MFCVQGLLGSFGLGLNGFVGFRGLGLWVQAFEGRQLRSRVAGFRVDIVLGGF